MESHGHLLEHSVFSGKNFMTGVIVSIERNRERRSMIMDFMGF